MNSKLTTVRVIASLKNNLEVFVLIAVYENGRIENRSFLSSAFAVTAAKKLAPSLAIKIEYARK